MPGPTPKPAASGYEPWSEGRGRQLASAQAAATPAGSLLPVLHALQHAFGYLPDGSLEVVADVLNLSVAEVYGVATFYRDFRFAPPGASVFRVCRAEACQSMGAESLAEHAKSSLGVGFGGTTADGAVSLEQVFCLGNCALAPSIMVGETVFGRVAPDRFDELVNRVRSEVAS